MNILFWISFGFLWIVVAIQGFAFLELLRQVSLLRTQVGSQQGALIMQGVADTGGTLPELSGISAIDLRQAHWEDYLVKNFSIVVLLSTHCTVCRAIAENLTSFASDVRDDVQIVALIEGTIDEAQNFLTQTKLDRRMVIIDQGGITGKRFRVDWYPGAITIRGHKIGEAAVINNITQLGALVQSKDLEHAIS